MGQAAPFRAEHPAVDSVRIKAQIRRLLQDGDFRTSDRNKRFLDFVVTETLEGRSERIKAYTIAVDVFGRSEDFDPSIDPIVRIEATRLRFALRSYYAGPGASAEIRVLIPKGRYIPTFMGACGAVAPTFRHEDYGVVNRSESVLVLVEAMPGLSGKAVEAAALASELTIEGLRRKNIRVICAPSEGRVAARKAFEELLENPGSTFAIDIAANVNGLSWRVSSLSSSEILSIERLQFSPVSQSPVDDMQKVADRIGQFILASAPLKVCSPNGRVIS